MLAATGLAKASSSHFPSAHCKHSQKQIAMLDFLKPTFWQINPPNQYLLHTIETHH
jgi:hypothetical protein